MKTKLFLIALAFGLMSSTCTPEEQQQYDCECETVYYERQQTGWSGASPVYTLVETGRTGFVPMECENQTDDYVMNGNVWYRVNCQSVE